MGKFFRVFPHDIRVRDFVNMRRIHDVFRLVLAEFLRRVNEKHVANLAAFFEDDDAGRYPRIEEDSGRQPDHRVNVPVLQKVAADDALRAAAE